MDQYDKDARQICEYIERSLRDMGIITTAHYEIANPVIADYARRCVAKERDRAEQVVRRTYQEILPLAASTDPTEEQAYRDGVQEITDAILAALPPPVDGERGNVMATIEIRNNDNGTLDEVVAKDAFVHLEQMDIGHWWLGVTVGDRMVHVHLSSDTSITAEVIDDGDEEEKRWDELFGQSHDVLNELPEEALREGDETHGKDS